MSGRVPDQYRHRWAYAALAGLAGTVFLALFIGVAGSFGTSSAGDLRGAPLGLLAAPAAAICWPRGRRTKGRMFGAGALTVLLSIVLIMASAQGLIIVQDVNGTSAWEELAQLPFVIAAAVFFGSLFTLGIPYVIAGVLSLLFADAKTQEPPR